MPDDPVFFEDHEPPRDEPVGVEPALSNVEVTDLDVDAHWHQRRFRQEQAHHAGRRWVERVMGRVDLLVRHALAVTGAEPGEPVPGAVVADFAAVFDGVTAPREGAIGAAGVRTQV